VTYKKSQPTPSELPAGLPSEGLKSIPQPASSKNPRRERAAMLLEGYPWSILPAPDLEAM
jgi:hypothetical protein